MATQIVELTGDEASLLRSLDKVIQKQLEYERKLRDTGEAADAAGFSARDAMENIKAEGDKALNGILRDLKSLGGEGSQAAAALRDHLQGAGKAGHKSMEDLIAQLKLIDPAAADAAESARESFAKMEADKMLSGLMSDLKMIGPEGAGAAAALRDHLQDAGMDAKTAMDGVIAKIREINPEAAAAAEAAAAKIKQELSEAANYSEREFGDVLDELRALGPEGRQAATELKKHLVDAGKVGEKSMQDVIAKIEQMDPEAAKVARSIANNLQNAGQQGESSFVKFGKSAVGELTSIVTAYVGISEAIQLVNEYLQTQLELLTEAKDAQIELGKAQQDSLKNLAGLSVIERNELLRDAVPDIARKSGFSDVARITQAIGTVASVGESDPARIANAVMQSARIETLNPEKLSTTAAAAVDVQRKSGLDDVRQGIALFQTTLSQARIESADQLATALPKAVGSAVSTVPNQDRLTAAREAAALFSQITQGGTDVQGQSSATFITDLTVRMSKFFTEMDEERIKARSQIELIDRKIEKGKDTELDRLKKTQANEFLTASEGVQDPGTLFSRLAMLQSSSGLSDRFVGEGFGEKQFNVVLQDLLKADSDRTKAMQQSFEIIKADVNYFEDQVSTLNQSTPQLVIANAAARLSGGIVANNVSNTEGATLASVRQITEETLRQASGGSWAGWWQNRNTLNGSLVGSTAAEEAVDAVLTMSKTMDALKAGGITKDEAIKIDLLESQIDNITRLLEGASKTDALSSSSAAAASLQLRFGYGQGDSAFIASNPQIFDRILAVLETIAANSDETAQNTKTSPTVPPAVTPALSLQTP